MDMDYKPNSHAYKEGQRQEAIEKKKVEKVVRGTVKTKKKSELGKLGDIFISEDASNVKSYIFMDVLVPAIKKAAYDIVTDGLSMFLYGSTNGKSRTDSKVSYRNYYDEPRNRSNNQVRTRFDYDDIIYESRGEAERVRSQMEEMIDRYQVVSVADMYDAAGLTAPYTANKYGWTNIRTAEPVRVRGGGYILKLPKAMPID